MAEYLKSQTPQELWKASLKPKDPLKPDDAGKSAMSVPPLKAATAAGIGALLDTSA
jgi:hypothetical protein